MTSQLETPEVNLYYTVRGSGPMFLILQGGAGNADGAEALADELSSDFTVVTYDRRGLSRSTPIRAERYEIATHADDVARLIGALSGEPAFVFGSSLGALIGVELVARHPGVVRLLIAHEPGLYALLEGAERDEALRGHTDALETFQREGMPAAMKLMFARSGTDMNDPEAEIPALSLSTADPKAMEQHFANLRHFLTCDVPAVTRYRPEVDAVTAARSKIIPAIGSASSPSALPYRCTVALAGVLHRTPVEFPGGHTAYMLRPKGVAHRIRELIRLESC
ncbi:MAG: alpha/beta fold hydrolase [Terriglobia bacterium]